MKRNPEIAHRWWNPPQEVASLLVFVISALASQTFHETFSGSF